MLARVAMDHGNHGNHGAQKYMSGILPHRGYHINAHKHFKINLSIKYLQGTCVGIFKALKFC